MSGLLEPTTILDESSIVPSRAIVYTVSLLSTSRTSDSDNSNNSNSTQEAFAVLPISITASGAYTILLSHTVEEVPLTIESPSGEALTPIVSETDHAHEDSEAHAEEEDTEAAEEEEDGDGENRNGTAAQWANALAASFIISLCRLVCRLRDYVWQHCRQGTECHKGKERRLDSSLTCEKVLVFLVEALLPSARLVETRCLHTTILHRQ